MSFNNDAGTSQGKHYLLYGSERYALAILRPVQSEIRRRGGVAAWFFDGPGAEDLQPDETLLRSTAEVRSFAPLAVITPSNAVPHFFPGVKVQIFHGFDAGKPRHIHVRGFFDLYCTTGPDDTRAFQNKAQALGHFAVVETGWPKMDQLLSGCTGEPPPVRKPPVILYHSTFSPAWSAAATLYDCISSWSRSGEWRWIVTLHPKTDPRIAARYRALQGPYLHFSDVDNILHLFPSVDMMISDTSSALSEFLLAHKPVVTYKNRKPGPQLIDIDTTAALRPAIERALSRPPALMAAIRDYAKRIHPYADGCSSARVLDAVDGIVANGAENPRVKPLNTWRKLRMRKRIGYWGR